MMQLAPILRPGSGIRAATVLALLAVLVLAWSGQELAAADTGTVHVVDAGFVSLDGYATNETTLAAYPRADARLRELENAYRGAFRVRAKEIAGAFLGQVGRGVTNLQVSCLAGDSLSAGRIDPASVYLWMWSVDNIVTLPEVYHHASSQRYDQLLAVTFAFHLIHLESKEFVFGEQAMVILQWRDGRPFAEDNLPEQLIAKLAEALPRGTQAAATRFRNALTQPRRSGGAGLVYAVAPRDVRLPENVESMLQQIMPAGADKPAGDSVRLLIAAATVRGLSRSHRVLPILPEELLRDLELGGRDRAGLWAIFNLGSLQDLQLPPGALLNRTRDGYVVISGRLPVPDYRIHARFDYSETVLEAREYQITREGRIRLNLDEVGEGHREALLPAITGVGRANYAVGQPFTARALALSTKGLFDVR